MEDIFTLSRRDHLAGGSVAQTNLALTIIFPCLAAITVAGRFYSRRLKRMTPGLDDWLILAALVLHFAQMSMGILRMLATTDLQSVLFDKSYRRC